MFYITLCFVTKTSRANLKRCDPHQKAVLGVSAHGQHPAPFALVSRMERDPFALTVTLRHEQALSMKTSPLESKCYASQRAQEAPRSRAP